MIEITNVTKSYQTLKAIDNISLHIAPGEVLGILGPNGAGKTTLFRLITGSLNPDEGQIRSINGKWPSVGYKPERLLFPAEMRVRGYLAMMASLTASSAAMRLARPHSIRKSFAARMATTATPASVRGNDGSLHAPCIQSCSRREPARAARRNPLTSSVVKWRDSPGASLPSRTGRQR